MTQENHDKTNPDALNRLSREQERDQALAAQIGKDVEDLVLSNISAMKRIMLDEGKETMSAAIKVDFQDEPGGWDIKTGISYSRKYKDERETHIDTEQGSLDFDSEGGEI